MAFESAKSPKDLIRAIREQYTGMKLWPRQNLNRAIETLAVDLYGENIHFIFELVQNAEDNSYLEGTRPTLIFRVHEEKSDGGMKACLIVENNETGFEKKHVEALCQVKQTTKKKAEGYIGEKGIGFKSVFRVTSCPSVHSNGYHFALPQNEKETGLGYIVPVEISEPPEDLNREGTTIVLPLDKKNSIDRVDSALREIAPETILFLSKLEAIEIDVSLSTEAYAISIKKSADHAPLVKLIQLKNPDEILRTSHYWLISKSFEKPAHIENEKRLEITSREISVAIPLDADVENPDKLFAYLPVWKKTGLPFLINADFLVVSSREGIHKEENWNLWLRDCIAPAYTEAFLSCVRNRSLSVSVRAQAYASIPMQSHQDFLDPVVDDIHARFRNENCILTYPSGRLATPGECRLIPKLVVRELFGEHKVLPAPIGKAFSFVHPKIESRYKDKLAKIAVPRFTEEDTVACLKDTAWLKHQTDEWFIRLYRYCMDFKKETLRDLKIVPAVVIGRKRRRRLLSSAEHPIYFQIGSEEKQIISDIPYWLRVSKPIAFVKKSFHRLLEKQSDEKRIRSWMTEELGLHTFTASAYCFDVLDYLKEQQDSINNGQLIQATEFIIKYADDNFDWKALPIILSDGRRTTLDEIRNQEESDNANCLPPSVKTVVVPETYDLYAGWQYIWVNEDDRQHFYSLSDCYPKDVIEGLVRLKVVDIFPEFRKQISKFPRITVCKIKVCQRSPSSFRNPDYQFSQAILKWLASEKACRPTEWPEYKYAFSGPHDPDWQWVLDLKYYTQDGEAYHVQTGPYQFESSYSEVIRQLRTIAWLPTTKGLVPPSHAFIPTTDAKEILGDTVPYFEGDLSPDMLKALEVNTEISVETLTKRLDMCREDQTMDPQLPKRIYHQIALRTNGKDTHGLRERFRRNRLVFLPNRTGQSPWCSSEECLWRDANKIFGEAFGYLEGEYPKLEDFFVGTLDVKKDADTQSYARRWLQLQEEPPSAGKPHRDGIETLYREISPTTQLRLECEVFFSGAIDTPGDF
ncbi:MAG: hypothetical protein R6U13_09435 [Desulfatiglandaceae bacterium]